MTPIYHLWKFPIIAQCWEAGVKIATSGEDKEDFAHAYALMNEGLFSPCLFLQGGITLSPVRNCPGESLSQETR